MKHLKLFFALFAMLALGVGNAWGAEATLSSISTKNVVASKGGSVSTTFGDVTCTVTKNSSNEPGFYTSSGIVRYYSTDVMKLSVGSGNVITKIVFTMTSGTVGTASPTGLSSDSKTWTGSAESVSFTGSATVKISKIVVTYEASGSTTPDPEEPGTSGETVTYVLKDDPNHPTNGVDWLSGTIDQYTGWTATKGGSNNPKYYDTGNGLRVYGGGEFTITSTKVMTSITLTFSGGGYTFSTDNTTNPQTVTPNATSYKWSVSRACRLQKIEITYAADGGGSSSGETVPSLTAYPTTIDFGTVYEGATVADKTVAVNFANLTGDVTYSGLSTPFSATGAISATGDKITILADASTIGEYLQTLTVASTTDSKTAEVIVKMNVVAAPAPTGTFELYSGELTEGDYVIYYNGSAMKAEVASSRLSYVEVAPTDNKIENPDAATIWHIAQSGTNWTIYNNDKGYAAGTGTANKAQLLSQEDITTGASASDNLKKASWTVTGTETYDFVNVFNSTKDSPVNANLRNNVNGGTNYGFACYATNTGGALTLYKKSDGKQAAGLAYATDKYLVKFGDEFTAPELTNPKTLTVTYGSSNEDVATVDATGAITVKAVGYATITASFGGTEEIREGSAKYTLCVTEHAGTQADPYSVADARRVIDVMETAEGVYATGIVSKIVTAYSEQYGNITYNISIDGSTAADQLQAYRGKGVNGENFSSANDIKVGDEVIVKGNLKKHETTYEFDADNQLVSLKRDKQQAGLAYEEKEHTANVGEDFTEPTLTNPNSLTVTYSSSNTALATVDATTGEVSILAAGKVTITASSAADATYAAGSASYNITISDPSLAVAQLPFTYTSGKADIETTAGITQEGLDSDYTSAGSPKLKFDGTGDNVIIHFDGEPGKLSYEIKGNSYSGGTFTVQESADGSAYTNIVEYTELGSTETKTHTLAATSRYVKFIYTNKSDGNVALGNIKIALPEEEPEQPGEGGGETPEERLTDWVLTSAADITINDLVVITMTKEQTTWAMTNDKGTSAAPVASKVTVTANALAAEPAENLKWVVSNDNGTLTIYPYNTYESWLYCINNNNGVRVGTGDAKEFTLNANYLYTSQTSDPRHIGVYETNNDWRCYKPSSGAIATNIAGQTLKFFVKKNANDVLPGAGEEPEDPEGGEGGETPVVPTINPTATFIFNTAEGLNDLGIAYPVTPTTVKDGTEDAFKTEFENNATFTQDGITMTSTNGATVTRVWLTADGKLDLRVYKGATLTFSVPAEHKISKVVFDGTNISHLLVNGNAVSGNAWTGSAQTITFTTKDDAKTIKINTIAFVVEYTRDVTNKYGTICLPYGSTNYVGATFYRVAGKETGKVYLESVDALEAGVPYIFEKTASQIKVTYEGEAVDDPVNTNANGLVGTFTNETVVPEGAYILHQNAFRTSDNPANPNKVNAYRAYLNMANVEGDAPQQMPGRRYIGMSVQGENGETGFENITAPAGKTVKVIENGQLIIIRNGEKFNAQGMRL